MDFKNRTVIITGAARGIGRATAELFAEHQANVVITDINEEALLAFEKDLTAKGVKVLARVCDVREEALVHAVVQQTIETFGKIDVLVNNAGIYLNDMGAFAESKSEQWKMKIESNILGTMYFTHAVLPSMMEHQYGRIVNLGSVAGVYGLRNMVDYSMTKGGVIAFSRALSKEVGSYGITVNAVSPGNIHETNEFPEMAFLNRSGTPRECANLICFLASDDASYISGQNYQVDGSRKTM